MILNEFVLYYRYDLSVAFVSVIYLYIFIIEIEKLCEKILIEHMEINITIQMFFQVCSFFGCKSVLVLRQRYIICQRFTERIKSCIELINIISSFFTLETIIMACVPEFHESKSLVILVLFVIQIITLPDRHHIIIFTVYDHHRSFG